MTAYPQSVELANLAALAASDKMASDIVAFDVSDRMALVDVFLVVTAETDRQVGAVVDEIEDRLREAGVDTYRREGWEERTWVLLDFLDLVVHVQTPSEREYYALDKLWADCPTLDLNIPADAKAGAQL